MSFLEDPEMVSIATPKATIGSPKPFIAENRSRYRMSFLGDLKMVLITAPNATIGSLWKGIDDVDVGLNCDYLERKRRLLQGIGAECSLLQTPPA